MMKSILRPGAFVLLIGTLFYLSCKKEKSCENCRDNNTPPIASERPDQVITYQPIVFHWMAKNPVIWMGQ